MHEVRLVLEKDGWKIYKDECYVSGMYFLPKDRSIAKSEARMLAKSLSPCIFKVIDYAGIELSNEVL